MDAQDGYWDGVACGNRKRFCHPLLIEEFGRHVHQGSRILDYGCGYGRSIRELHQRGFANLFGMDYSSGMLARARKENPFAGYVRNAGRDIPFSDGSFDAIFLLAVLTCIPDTSDQARLFAEMHRVLKAGGIAYISDLLINDDRRNKVRYERFEGKYGCYGVFELEEGVTLRHHPREHLARLAALFTTIGRQEFCVETMNGHEARAIRMVIQKQPHDLHA